MESSEFVNRVCLCVWYDCYSTRRLVSNSFYRPVSVFLRFRSELFSEKKELYLKTVFKAYCDSVHATGRSVLH